MCRLRCAHTIDEIGTLTRGVPACVAAPSARGLRLIAKFAEHVFRRRIRFVALLLIPFALGLSVVVAFANYRAAATLRIEDPSAYGTAFLPVGWNPSQTPAQNLAESIGQVVKTPEFAASLSSRLASSGAIASTSELQQAIASASTNLKAVASSSHLVTLSFTCPHPTTCMSVITSTVAIFHDQLVKIQQDQAAAAKSFWTSQLKDAQSNLAAAEAALQSYAAANPTVSIDAGSADPQVVQLTGNVQLWRAKVVEAQNGLSEAQYLGNASARFLQIGTTVVDPAHMVGSRFVGDGNSLAPGVLVTLLGLGLVAAYLAVLVWADRTAFDSKLMERRLGVPVVATIPKLVGSGGV